MRTLVFFLLLAGSVIGQDFITKVSPVSPPSVTAPEVYRVSPFRINTQVSLPKRINDTYPNLVVVGFPTGGGTANKGSGTYIGNGLVISASHVNNHSLMKGYCIFPQDGRIDCRVINTDRSWDVCLIKLDRAPSVAQGVPLAIGNPNTGDVVWIAGYSQQELLYRKSAVKGYKSNGSGKFDWIDVTQPSWPGDSGGGMFNDNGEFIGPLWGSDFRGSTIGTTAGRLQAFLTQWGFPGGCPPGGRSTPSNPRGERPRTSPPDPGPTQPNDGDLLKNEEFIKTLLDKLAADPRFRGPKGDKGDVGQPGPKGEKGDKGDPGKDAVLDLDALADLISKKVPGITVRTVDSKGRVLDSEYIPPGGKLNIHHKPIGQ